MAWIKEYKVNGDNVQVINVCQRCGGKGRGFWQIENGICFGCQGVGKVSLPDISIEEYNKTLKRQEKALIKKLEKGKKLFELFEPIRNIKIEINSFSENWLENLGIIEENRNFFKSPEIQGFRMNLYKIINKIEWFRWTNEEKRFQEYYEKITEMKKEFDSLVNRLPEMKEKLQSLLNEIEQKTNFVGVVGEKIELELTIEKIIPFDTKFGKSELFIMKDDIGNVFKKFGTINEKFISQKHDSDCRYLHEKDKVKFLAEVKEHSIYQGEKQTLLGRVSQIK